MVYLCEDKVSFPIIGMRLPSRHHFYVIVCVYLRANTVRPYHSTIALSQPVGESCGLALQFTSDIRGTCKNKRLYPIVSKSGAQSTIPSLLHRLLPINILNNTILLLIFTQKLRCEKTFKKKNAPLYQREHFSL